MSMVDDVRIIFVKFADRIHNLKTLGYHKRSDKQRRIATESLDIYAPIAARLGMYEFKEKIETECFRHLYPEEHKIIIQELKALKDEQRLFIKNARRVISQLLVDKNIPIKISARVKSPYSIYLKLQRKRYERVSDLYDIFAMRIVTDSIQHCYEILGIIHNKWTPLPNRFKDYIALPKENHYQSLHTTVVGIFREFRKKPTEIQIRTEKMDAHAEIGIAAHFYYSEF